MKRVAYCLISVHTWVGFYVSSQLFQQRLSLYFTVLMWGKEIAEQWLASILISNGQDIFVVQPTKVMLAVIVISLLLSKNDKNKSRDAAEKESEESDAYDIDIDFLSDDPKQRFKHSLLEKMRIRSKKEAHLTDMVKEIILHLIFMFLLAVVCYGNKNENRYLMTTTMRNPFTKFDLVRLAIECINYITIQS